MSELPTIPYGSDDHRFIGKRLHDAQLMIKPGTTWRDVLTNDILEVIDVYACAPEDQTGDATNILVAYKLRESATIPIEHNVHARYVRELDEWYTLTRRVAQVTEWKELT